MVFVVEDLIQDDIKHLTKVLDEEGKKIKAKIDALYGNFEQYIKTGDSSFLQKDVCKISDTKENSVPVIPVKKAQEKKGVLSDITENNVPVTVLGIKIKREKISEVFASQTTSLMTVSEENDKSNVNSTVNSNNDEDMPAPKQLPPRKRKIKEEPLDLPKRSTRTRKKPKRYTALEGASDGKISDVMIQNTAIPTVDVTDESDKEVEKGKTGTEPEFTDKQEVEPIRSKRTRTIRKTKTELTAPQNNPITNASDKTYIADKNSVNSSQKEFEDDVPNTKSPVNTNATFTARTEPVLMNCTVVIEKANQVKDDEIITTKTPTKPKKKKEIFSPFDKVTTKAKVEAFEKLNAVSKTALVSSPSLRTRGNKQAEEDQQKPCTPILSKLPTKVHSTTKVNKFINREGSTCNNSLLSTKSQSALKASQAEYRERLKKKQEKELEASKKREAILLALTEEKRKKREEKQLKAQQQREIMEKEKLKLMEAQKLKEEKYKQALAEKEEKNQKQREEAERKLLHAKKRAEEMKARERNQKLASRDLPVYMITEAPLLPTDDCYDSDDEDSERVQPKDIPDWSKERELRRMQVVMLKIGEQIKNTFFSRQVHTPDLQEIFEKIDPRKLKRTSSAVWRKPPRYTLFLETSSIQFSEDDE